MLRAQLNEAGRALGATFEEIADMASLNFDLTHSPTRMVMNALV